MNTPNANFLLSELSQAWTHYRHLEETRLKYLSFFATVILATSGFLVSLMRDFGSFKVEQFVTAASVFVLVLFMFSFFVWANVTRIGYVLAAYEHVMKETRKHMLGEGSPAYEVWNIRAHIPPEVSRGVFRIQSTARNIVMLVCVALLLAESYMACVVLARPSSYPRVQAIVMVIVCGAMFIVLLYGRLCVRSADRFSTPASSISPLKLHQP